MKEIKTTFGFSSRTKNNMIITGAKYLDKLYICVDAVYTTRDDITSHTDDTVSIAHRIL